jgi:hypothetical protein
MDRMLVVVFDNETKAYEGEKALLQLDNEGSITLYAHKVVVKQADNTVQVKEGRGRGPVGTLVGTVLGSLVEDVNKQLAPNKVAVIAEVKEDWTTPVDSRMESIGGVVYRRALSEVRDTIHDENIKAMKADLAQMKAERAKAKADRDKARLEEKIKQLETKIQVEQQKAKDQREAAARESEAKIQMLKAKEAALKSKVAKAS